MDATFWATVGLVVFLALVVYLRVPGMIGRNLDQRAERIRNELEEARKLREEAQQLLAEYQRKRKEAEQEAGEIVEAAKREAGHLVEEAKQRSQEYVARRTTLAEQKIAQAERDAVNAVRSNAVDIAVAAASRLLEERADAKVKTQLFKSSLDDIKARMN